MLRALMRRVGGASLALVLVVLVAACTATPGRPPASPSSAGTPTATPTGAPSAASPTPGAGSSETTPTGPTAPTGATELTIVVDAGEGASTTWRLTCDPPGGDHPDPATACQVLADHAAALQPVRTGAVCTQVYGGPETATITGTYRGKAVNSRFSRTNGCQTGRWTALTGLLPPGGAR